MKIWKILAVAPVVYVGLVVAFESSIGYFQPESGSTVLLTTFDADGTPYERVVTGLTSDGKLYVAANHWPRAWYERALAHPDVEVAQEGGKRDYRAVPVAGAEHDRVEGEHRHGLVFRILTGFPPRYFLRLDPR